ncbi:Piso0_005900 [Millerozyma farinosa CBS 7064]|uniref:Piso0_005900 protein n=1 Tax=Pichia sorbitophila (strain ATCC MYA-4447 / BCRC 22081 / CBS 7064 / NBRC 10061 / NRRL Y-12695) TaxID=559304 RepID=G8Y380_PICSO|nr:Piso0_005900 [Millerozyma farinosa CBS 7064]
MNLDIRYLASGRQVNGENNVITEDIQRYTPGQTLLMRSLAMSSSSVSILAGLVGFYFFLYIDPKRRLFRHQLIVFLIIYDFIKAVFLLLYPARVLTTLAVYYDLRFCRVVGFFTAMSIEGSDFAILSIAIHTALIVYKPQQKIQGGNLYDGGLFRYRYLIYVLSFLIPIVMASLAFIHNVGYVPLTIWCYMPTSPLWYRLALSWVPRYAIILSICILYCCIYVHVIKQQKHIRQVEGGENKSFGRKLCSRMVNFCVFLFVSEDGNSSTSSLGLNGSTRKEDTEDTEDNVDLESIRGHLNKFTKKQISFQRSKKGKQIGLIFVYPISYVVLWIAPLVVHGIQFKTGVYGVPIIWLSSIASFMQPFNCTVDTLVFLMMEKPWKLGSKEQSVYGRYKNEILGSFPGIKKKIQTEPDHEANQDSAGESEQTSSPSDISFTSTQNSISLDQFLRSSRP